MAKKLASRDEILALDDLRTKDVEVPEWGGLVVRLRSLDALSGMRLARELGQDEDEARVRIVLAACVNEDGAPLFEPEDLEKLARKSFDAIRRISDAALEMFRGQADVESAKENF